MCGGPLLPVKETTPQVKYPFGEKLPKTALEISDTIRVLSFPTGMAVGDVNVIAIREVDGPFKKGWTIIDTGPDTEAARDAWDKHFDETLDGLPITRVIVTHAHSDHVGLAGYLTRRNKGKLWIPRVGWYMTCMGENRPVDDSIAETQQFLKACGYSRSMQDAYADNSRAKSREPTAPITPFYRPLDAGQVIRIGGMDWEVVFAQGHAPDHAVLICREAGLAIVGDQILPGITPNVSVNPAEAEADPLGACFFSSAELAKKLDDEIVTIPGHGAPFTGAASRIETIIKTHEKSQDRLLAAIAQPITTIECFEAFYRRDLDPVSDAVALAQTRSYLNRLLYAGKAKALPRPDGVILWSAA